MLIQSNKYQLDGYIEWQERQLGEFWIVPIFGEIKSDENSYRGDDVRYHMASVVR